MEKKMYTLQEGGQIAAGSVTEFVTELRKGSRFDHDATDVEYMLRFAERYQQLSGHTIRTGSPDVFLEDLIAFGYANVK